jgi:hypothetical protein
MRVPVLSFNNPALELWLAEGPLLENSPQFTLRDARNRHYLPGEIKGPLLVRAYMCPRSLYDAARQAGYPLVWID